MDRRTILALGTIAVAGTTLSGASACSIAVPPPEIGGDRLQAIFRFFQAWWKRDRGASQSFFEDSSGPSELYAELFTEEGLYRQWQAITLVDGVAFFSVVERHPDGVGADCSNMPQVHRFLLDFDIALRAVRHLGSGTDRGTGQVTHWSGGG